jgi:hypothetical protein
VQDDSDTKRAVRTALRSIEAMAVEPPSEESCQHMAAAVQQVAFAIEKLIAKVEKLESRPKHLPKNRAGHQTITGARLLLAGSVTLFLLDWRFAGQASNRSPLTHST